MMNKSVIIFTNYLKFLICRHGKRQSVDNQFLVSFNERKVGLDTALPQNTRLTSVHSRSGNEFIFLLKYASFTIRIDSGVTMGLILATVVPLHLQVSRINSCSCQPYPVGVNRLELKALYFYFPLALVTFS